MDETTARWLTTAAARQHLAEVVAELDAHPPGEELGLLTRLRTHGLDAAQAGAVLEAATARRRARRRFRDAEQLLFTRTGLEQASDPAVARWRARRYDLGQPVVDLCAGIGGDSLELARHAPVTAVDLDAARLVLLAYNAATRGVPVTTRCSDVLEVDLPPTALVHVDPGRRTADGRRIRTLAGTRPPVPALADRLAACAGAAIVLPPAVDLDDPGLPRGTELEFVAVRGQLLEAVAWSAALRRPGTAATATLLDGSGGVVTHSRPTDDATGTTDLRPPAPGGGFASVLLEPHPAAVRARLHEQLAAGLGTGTVRRIARHRAALTSEELPAASPWFRRHRVLAVMPARPAALRRWLRSQPATEIELRTSGIGTDLERFWRELGRPPRGPNGWRIELVRLDTGVRAVVTESVDAPWGAPPRDAGGRPATTG